MKTRYAKRSESISHFKRYWQRRTHCCGYIVAHDVSWAAQTGKHLLRTQNVSEQNRKHLFVRNKCCARGQTGKHLCRQQCVLVCQGLNFAVCSLIKQDLTYKQAHLVSFCFVPWRLGQHFSHVITIIEFCMSSVTAFLQSIVHIC